MKEETPEVPRFLLLVKLNRYTTFVYTFNNKRVLSSYFTTTFCTRTCVPLVVKRMKYIPCGKLLTSIL